MSTEHAPHAPDPQTSADPADPRPIPPDPPLPSECCESGCPICVHDLYAEDMAKYRLDLAAWDARQASRVTPDRAGD